MEAGNKTEVGKGGGVGSSLEIMEEVWGKQVTVDRKKMIYYLWANQHSNLYAYLINKLDPGFASVNSDVNNMSNSKKHGMSWNIVFHMSNIDVFAKILNNVFNLGSWLNEITFFFCLTKFQVLSSIIIA